MSDDDVRAAARAELAGYWTWAAARPWLFLATTFADLPLAPRLAHHAWHDTRRTIAAHAGAS